MNDQHTASPDVKRRQSIDACYNRIWNTREHLEEMRQIKREAERLPEEGSSVILRRWGRRLYTLMQKVIEEIEEHDGPIYDHNFSCYMRQVMDMIDYE